MSVLSSKNYLELIQEFPPRMIHSNEELEAIQDIVNALLDAGEMTADVKDYLDLLGLLIQEYEDKNVEIPDISGVELLRALIDEFGLKQKDLVPIFKTESIVSEVLKGKRKFTTDHIEKLGAFFNISPSAFL